MYFQLLQENTQTKHLNSSIVFMELLHQEIEFRWLEVKAS